jgi:tetratricopeptide (TPR) repeat protein
MQAKAILDAHRDFLDSPQVVLSENKNYIETSKNLQVKQDIVNEDGLAPLGGTWPAATAEDRITPQILQDPAQHLHTLQNCAVNYMKRGRFGEALHLLDLILDCQRNKNGTLHEDVGSALHNVGIAHLRMEEHYKALQAFEEAVRVRKGALGRDHPQVAVSLVKVGITLLLLQRLEDSLWIFRDALTVRKHALGALHPSTARVYNNIGCVHVEFKELKEARRAFEAALDVQRNALVHEPDSGPILFGAATTLQNLAYLYRKREMHEKAAMLTREALSVSTMLCMCCLERKRCQFLIVFSLSLLLQLQEKVLGLNHPTVLSTLDSLADACGAANHGNHALKYYNELLERLHDQDDEDGSNERVLQEAIILYKMSRAHLASKDLDSQLSKLQLASKLLRTTDNESSNNSNDAKQRQQLEHQVQVDMRLARQSLEKQELEWV